MVHLLEWLGKKKETDIIGGSLRHFEKVLNAVRHLNSAVKYFVEGKEQSELKALLHEIANDEHEADSIRKQLIFEIAGGYILPPDHGDLLAFVYRIDSIADCAHSAGRCMSLWSGEFLEEAKSELIGLTDTALTGAEKVKSALTLMKEKSKQKIVEICSEIETLEDVADDQKRELLIKIINSNLPVGKLLTARDLVESIENICDNEKICADMLQLLVIEL